MQKALLMVRKEEGAGRSGGSISDAVLVLILDDGKNLPTPSPPLAPKTKNPSPAATVGMYQGPLVMAPLQYAAPPPRREPSFFEGCLAALCCCCLIEG
ncbi:hypothetical protein GUJ93_ZPchr0011g27331 [Zizania palustris]|uniref:Cysteine-rich transmembrane domain-containing protein n=1 Tax=Zizania palustris TaxID=103762 RepID=A0A8J5WG87_ZIZPA|nr:hypothetical protein GUJ93_ZPchr0011g27331 [Zizania palustris]KAG8090998.1 hypothetical protein GUJ93_ZPchr0011g27331 [Zizania palustris]